MNPRRYFFIIIGLLVGVMVVGAAGYAWALILVSQNSHQLAMQLGEQEAADAQITNLQLTAKAYETKIVPILSEIQTAMPKTKNQTDLLLQLQQSAQASGIAISNVTFAPAQDKLPSNATQTTIQNGLLVMPVSFSVTGSFAQLQSFLERVENLSRVTAVTNLTVSRSGTAINYAMTVNAFIKP